MEIARGKNSTIVRSKFANGRFPDGEAGTHVQSADEEALAAAAPDIPAEMPAEAAWIVRDWRYALLRGGMRGLSRTAPTLAVAMFDRIWFTPPRTAPRMAGRTWLARGQPFDVRVHGQPVRAWSWGAGPSVLLVHGWGGNAAQLHMLGGPLLERGFRVIGFDAPAHGASGPSRLGGRRVSMLEIADALRVVAAAAGSLAGLVAHSGGCTATALALREGWAGPERMAFIAPFALPSLAIEPFGRAIGASATVTARFRAQVEHRFARPWTDFDIPTLPGLRRLPPVLLVHDREDREVPWFHGQAVARAWPGARLVETRGLGHRRVLRDAVVLSQLAGFMAEGRAPTRTMPGQARCELDHDFASSGLSAGGP